MKKIPKNILYVLIAFIALGVVLFAVPATTPKPTEVTLSRVAEQVSKGEVEKILVAGDKLTVKLKDGSTEQTFKEPNVSLKEYGLSRNCKRSLSS